MSKHVPSWDSVNTLSNVDERIALIQEFHSYLVERGYANRTMYLYCSVAAHFLRWQHEAGCARQRVDAPSVSRFLLKHVPVWSGQALCDNPVKLLSSVQQRLLRNPSG